MKTPPLPPKTVTNAPSQKSFEILEGPVYLIRGPITELTIIQVPRGAVSTSDGSFLTFVRGKGPGSAVQAVKGMFFTSEVEVAGKYADLISAEEDVLRQRIIALGKLRRNPLVIKYTDG